MDATQRDIVARNILVAQSASGKLCDPLSRREATQAVELLDVSLRDRLVKANANEVSAVAAEALAAWIRLMQGVEPETLPQVQEEVEKAVVAGETEELDQTVSPLADPGINQSPET